LEWRDLPMDNYRRGIKLLPEMFSKENPYTRWIVLEELEKLDLSQDKKVFYKGVLEWKEEIKNSDDEKIEDER
jgi:archaeosine-15-forming tRNA-guanine transglycosylase